MTPDRGLNQKATHRWDQGSGICCCLSETPHLRNQTHRSSSMPHLHGTTTKTHTIFRNHPDTFTGPQNTIFRNHPHIFAGPPNVRLRNQCDTFTDPPNIRFRNQCATLAKPQNIRFRNQCDTFTQPPNTFMMTLLSHQRN